MRLERVGFLVLVCLLLLGCDDKKSSDDGGYTTSSPSVNSMVQVAAAFKQAVKKFGALQLGDPSPEAHVNLAPPLVAGSFSQEWLSTDFLHDPLRSTEVVFVGFSSWVKSILKSTSVNDKAAPVGPSSRMRETFALSCFAGVLLEEKGQDEEGNPVLGDYSGENSLVLTAKHSKALNELCDFPVVEEDFGSRFDVLVAEANLGDSALDGTLYDREIRVKFPVTSFIKKELIVNFYLKDSDSEVSFAASYNQEGSHREIAYLNLERGTALYEYVHGPKIPQLEIGGVLVSVVGPPGNYSVYRMLYDAENDEAYIVGDYDHYVPKTLEFSSAKYQRFAVAAKTSVSNKKISLSTLFAESSNSQQPKLRDACVNAVDSSLDVDGTRCVQSMQTLSGISADSLDFISDLIKGYNSKCEKVNLQKTISFDAKNINTFKVDCI